MISHGFSGHEILLPSHSIPSLSGLKVAIPQDGLVAASIQYNTVSYSPHRSCGNCTLMAFLFVPRSPPTTFLVFKRYFSWSAKFSYCRISSPSHDIFDVGLFGTLFVHRRISHAPSLERDMSYTNAYPRSTTDAAWMGLSCSKGTAFISYTTHGLDSSQTNTNTSFD